jgi:putative N6-adenine-specific DNA methylase
MAEQTALSKRIKRHVVGRSRDYFAATAPGLERLCLRELNGPPFSVTDATATHGGVTFRGKLVDCYLANLNLRTAGRVLMRIATFKATGYRDLKNHLGRIPWELYLSPATPAGIRATAVHCRVRQTADIAEQVARSITAAIGLSLPGDPPPGRQTVFIRGENDRFTVSIDSSGELLYRRGIKVHKGRAPIRETLAAAVLSLAGWGPQMVLADPMCGSGSFSLEAAMAAKRIPPGWYRSFAFENWPSFANRRWRHIKEEHGRGIVSLPRPLIFASDIDADACEDLKACVHRHHLEDAVTVSCKDFFGIRPKAVYPSAGLVVINPPYGRRLRIPDNIERIYSRIGEKLARDFTGWRAAIIVTEKRLARWVPVKGKSYRLLHGGISLRLMVGRI